MPKADKSLVNETRTWKDAADDVHGCSSWQSPLTSDIGAVRLEDKDMDRLFGNDKEPLKKPAQKKTRARNEIWDAVLKVFNMTDVSKSAHTRIGKVVRDLKARNATPDQILARRKRYQEMWPRMACTPEAIEKHWDDLDKPAEGDWGVSPRRTEPMSEGCTDNEKKVLFREWQERRKAKP